MSTEVKTPDFDDLLAAYDIPDLAEKSTSSLTSEHSGDHYGNSGQGEVKNKVKGTDKDSVGKDKENEEELRNEKDDAMTTDEEDDKLVIDENVKSQSSPETARGKHDVAEDTKCDTQKYADQQEKGTLEKKTELGGKESEKKDKKSARRRIIEKDDIDQKLVKKNRETAAVKVKIEDGEEDSSTTVKKETVGHSCAAEQLKQLSENYMRDKEKKVVKKTPVNLTDVTSGTKSSCDVENKSGNAAGQKVITTQYLHSKTLVKIAPKSTTAGAGGGPVQTMLASVRSVSPVNFVPVTTGSQVLPPSVTTPPGITVPTQKLLVLTTGSQGAVTNAIAKSNMAALPTTTMTTEVGGHNAVESTHRSSIIDALENSGPTVNVVVPNNLLKRNNPVPRYVPKMPPKEWNLKIPEGGYRCLECSDAFVMESSLSMHLERRSMNIAYACEICNKKLVFYNKCSLLRHVRLHYSKSAKNITVSLKSVDVSVLSKNITSLWPSRDRLGLPPSYQESEPSVKAPSQPHCTECNLVFANCQTRKIHFQASAGGKGPCNFSCATCGLQCPNKCYFQAHQRIHRNQSPYVCPECGEEKYDRELFYVHLNSTCIHFCRQAVYKCPQCNAGYPNIIHLKTHLQNAHTDSFCKCPICPMAFKSVENINNHMQAQHKVTNQGFRVIHKCPMCDTVFTQKNNLPLHLDSHILSKDMRIYVFKCNECYKHYDSKEVLEKHQLTVHKGAQLKDFICDVCRTPFKTYQFMLQHKNKHFDSSAKPPAVSKTAVSTAVADHPSGASGTLQCGACMKTFQKTEELAVHLKEHEKDGLFKCAHCDTKFSQRELFNTHMLQHEKKPTAGKHTCPDCGMVFSKWFNLNKHAKHAHGKVSKYPCHLCRRSFESNKSLQRHLRLKHKISPAYTCWHCEDGKKTFTKRSNLEKHLQTVHNISLASNQTDGPPAYTTTPMSDLVPRKRKGPNSEGNGKRAKFEFSSEYKCAKCDMTSKVRAEFQAHIKSHKTDNSLSQCRECGMCFRGDESLKKHLYMMHKVRDIAEYEMAVNNHEKQKVSSSGEGQAKVTKTTETSTTATGSVFKSMQDSALECNVCYRSFDNEIALRTHMRNHGMAFIRSKRCNSADSQ